jgi:hypothetical protein
VTSPLDFVQAPSWLLAELTQAVDHTGTRTLPTSPGVYCIFNVISHRRGAGLATRSVRGRVQQHVRALRAQEDLFSPMIREAQQFGVSSFRFFVLELLKEPRPNNIRRHLQAREGWWANELQALDESTGYNLEAGGQRSAASLFRERERRFLARTPARYEMLPGTDFYAPISPSLLRGRAAADR